MKRKIFSILFALLLVCSFSLVAAVPMAGEVQAATPIYVNAETGNAAFNGEAAEWDGEHGPKKTIQGGIGVVDTGGTVIVAAGTYDEVVSINKQLTLLGAQHGVDPTATSARTDPLAESIIDAYASTSGEGGIVEIKANSVTIDGFTVTGAQHHAIWISGYCGNTITNNILSENGWRGVMLRASADNNTITDNVISNNGREGIYVCSHGGGSSDDNTIENNVISYSGRPGINVDGSHDNTLEKNIISYSGLVEEEIPEYSSFASTGIRLGGSSHGNKLTGNTLSNQCNGIIIKGYSESNTLTDNTIVNNIGPGIWIFDGGNNNNIITNCDIQNNKKGISVEDTSSGIKAHYNNIVGNTEYGIYSESTETIDATNNWWGDGVTTTSAIESLISGDVDYSPWLVTSPITGTAPSIVTSDHPWTWYTDDSIQDAIGVASAKDTINVAAGTYTEDLVFDGDEAANITIKGATGTADDVVLEGYVLLSGATTGLTFDTIKFLAVHTSDLFDTNALPLGPLGPHSHQSLTVKNCHIVSDTARAVVVDMANAIGDNFHFINNIVEGFADAFYAVLYFEPTVTSVTTGWKLNDNKFINCGGTAIAVFLQNGIEVKNNVINYSVPMNAGTWGGISVAMGRDISNPNPILIEGNTVIGPGKTIHTGGGGNEFAGISICCWENLADANATIKGNTITDCWRGISVTLVSGVTIEDNNVSDCTAGISPEGVCNDIVNSGNNIHGNNVGILLPDDGTSVYGTAYSNPDGDNVFHHDNIVGNTDYGIQNLTGIVIDASNNWWDTLIGSEIDAMVSDYVDYSPWLDALYPGGEPTNLDVNTVSLASDWNLISLPLIPEDPAIATVLDGVAVQKVAYYTGGPEGSWLYYTGVPETSDLKFMNDGKGYWVDMGTTTTATLTVSGYEYCKPAPAVPPEYPLVEGWNLIGFKSLTPIEAGRYLGPAIAGSGPGTGTVEAMYGYDTTSDVYIVVRGDTMLVPGKGYWLAVSEAGTIYPFPSGG